MPFDDPLHLSRLLLATLGTHSTIYHPERVPKTGNLLVISKHRSILDAPLLMTAINRPIRFACHHYMSQVPMMREMVTALGALPLDGPGKQQKQFFQQATHLLQDQQAVGIFPEGGEPMIKATPPTQLNSFHRGFAHLALRAPIEELTILPIAIVSMKEVQGPIAPLKLFNFFDPSEPLFDRSGWHPAIIYQQVELFIGRPIWITDTHRHQYQGKQVSIFTKALTQACYNEINGLLDSR